MIKIVYLCDLFDQREFQQVYDFHSRLGHIYLLDNNNDLFQLIYRVALHLDPNYLIK